MESITKDIKDPFLLELINSGDRKFSYIRDINEILKIHREISHRDLEKSFIVQGVEGSGKLKVLADRIDYIVENKGEGIKVKVIAPNVRINQYMEAVNYKKDFDNVEVVGVAEYFTGLMNIYADKYGFENLYKDIDFKDGGEAPLKFVEQICAKGKIIDYADNLKAYTNSLFNIDDIFKIQNIGLRKFKLRNDITEIGTYVELTRFKNYIANLIMVNNSIINKKKIRQEKLNSINKEKEILEEKLRKNEKDYLKTVKKDISISFEKVKDLIIDENIYFNLEDLTNKEEIVSFLFSLENNINEEIKYLKFKRHSLIEETMSLETRIEKLHIVIENLNKKITLVDGENGILFETKNLRNSTINTMMELEEIKEEKSLEVTNLDESIINLNLIKNLFNSSLVIRYKSLSNMKNEIRNRHRYIESLINSESVKIEKLEHEISMFLENVLTSQELVYIESILRFIEELDVNIIYENTLGKLVRELEREYNVEKGNYDYQIPVYLYFLYLYFGPLYDEDMYIMTFEGQDISYFGYMVLYLIHGDRAIFNVFGNISKRTHRRALTFWGELGFISEVLKLNINYRHSYEIVSYINKTMGKNTISYGLHGPAVKLVRLREFKNWDKCQAARDSQGKLLDTAFIYKELNAEVREIYKNMEEEIVPYSMHEPRYLEFYRAYVYSGGMTSDMKYVSMSRALKELYIVE